MARKLRVQYPGAIYHVMNRADRREAIFLNDRALVGQDGTTVNESQKQFSFTRGALSTCERRKNNFLIQERIGRHECI
jgi:hypothetical protein